MSSSSTWTAKQNKLFENALAIYDKMEAAERWQYLARAVGGNKTIEEIKEHYQNLVEDVSKIESGEVPLPNYAKLGHSSCMDNNQRLRNLKL